MGACKKTELHSFSIWKWSKPPLWGREENVRSFRPFFLIWSPRRESNPHLHLRRVAGNPLPHREMNFGAPARSRTGPCDVGDRRASTTPRGRKIGQAPATCTPLSPASKTGGSLSTLEPGDVDGPCECRSRYRRLMRPPLLPLSYRPSRRLVRDPGVAPGLCQLPMLVRRYLLMSLMVLARGVEPPRVLPHWLLGPARLPVSPREHEIFFE